MSLGAVILSFGSAFVLGSWYRQVWNTLCRVDYQMCSTKALGTHNESASVHWAYRALFSKRRTWLVAVHVQVHVLASNVSVGQPKDPLFAIEQRAGSSCQHSGAQGQTDLHSRTQDARPPASAHWKKMRQSDSFVFPIGNPALLKIDVSYSCVKLLRTRTFLTWTRTTMCWCLPANSPATLSR